jgi:NADPH:quinone reductase
MKSITIKENGNEEVLKYEETEIIKPKNKEVLIKIHFGGVNFIDIYKRNGLYKVNFPFILGEDGAGEIEDVISFSLY